MRIELSDHPVWQQRVRMLARLLRGEQEVRVLIRRARVDFGWSGQLTRQVLAAGDGGALCYRNGRWRRAS
jgi:hypothetical protein